MIPRPLSPLDAAFLRLEDRRSSLHIASIAIFEGPPPAFAEVIALFAARMAAVPSFGRKLREAPLHLGAPAWIDDPHFRLLDHLRHTALPRPGSSNQLNDLVGRLMSHHFDRARPLWETWIVEGLEGDRWAMISKVHHSMADGIAGTDLLGVMLDETPKPSARTYMRARPAPARSARERLTDAAGATPRHLARAARQFAAGLRDPRSVGRSTRTRVHGLVGFAELARPASASSLSGRLGKDRCWAGASVSLDDVRVIRRVLGGTVNDVVLATVTRGFRDLLLSRGETPRQRTVRTLVPVSVRAPGQRGLTDNRITAMVAELPVHLPDAEARLAAVRVELDHLKQSGEAEAGVLITELAKFLPPAVVNAGLAVAFRLPQWFVVTVATNVPGPRKPLYTLGRRLQELYPYVPIADRVRLAVAISSYDGVLYFGVTADRDSIRDVGVLTRGIEEELSELLKIAAAPKRSPTTG